MNIEVVRVTFILRIIRQIYRLKHFQNGKLFSQSSRLEDQRSPLPNAGTLQDTEEQQSPNLNQQRRPQSGATVPEEDLFALIQRLQAGRMEDQRANGPGKT